MLSFARASFVSITLGGNNLLIIDVLYLVLIDVLYLVLIWVIPILLLWNYLGRIGKEKRSSLKKEMKQPMFIFGFTPMLIGLLLFLSGAVATISYLKIVGMSLTLIGWIVSCLVSVIKGERSPMYGVAMIGIGISLFIGYFYLV